MAACGLARSTAAYGGLRRRLWGLRQMQYDAACVGRHLATRNNMRVSGSRQLRVVVLVSLEAGLVIGRDSDKMMDERVLKEGFS